MAEGFGFEAAGNLSDWPKNVPGKRTQAAVFGMYHPEKGKHLEILWTGDFPDLESAMYWAAKKEVHAVRRQKWILASRVPWQHDLTPEQAVDVVRRQMEPQVERALRGYLKSSTFDLGEGPMKPIDHSKVQGYYVEMEEDRESLGEGDPSQN